MIRFTLLLLFFGWSQASFAQITVRGIVTDRKGEVLAGANVFLKNTFDGVMTDSTGKFTLKAEDKAQDTLVVSLLGFANFEQKLTWSEPFLKIALQEEATELNGVVLTAGTFEASDAKRLTVLKPLDIVRTASANGDIFGALQTLPGAQRVGESEGLFVRGGSANESKMLIDNMLVQNPFFSSVPDVRARGRFSPFLFKGTAFSTGGYSAQYGQALSSVLSLQTEDFPKESNVNVFLSHLTWGVSGTKKWENTSLAVSGNYTDVTFANKLVRQNIDWIKPFRGKGASATLRQNVGKNGMLKFFSNYGDTEAGFNMRTFAGEMPFIIKNPNLFNQLTYRHDIKDWTIDGGISQSDNQDNISAGADNVQKTDNRLQARLAGKYNFGKNNAVIIGGEAHQYTYKNIFNEFVSKIDEQYQAVFLEGEFYITHKIAARVGARAEHSNFLNRYNIAPRLSLAYKTGEFAQVSFAYGDFYQNPENKYLYVTNTLYFEKSQHFILNYQWVKSGYTFRTEAFYKSYQNLVRELDNVPFNADANRWITGRLDNSGNGYAQGVDIFWRDKKSIKNIDYWVSYSFIDTKRLYQNFPTQASPVFASKHNLSVVYKHFITKLNLDINATYSYASGRPYYNPNTQEFMKDLTPDYHNLSIGINYLTTIFGAQSVVIFSMDNILNRQNVFGYRYSPDGSQKASVNPPTLRSFFIGVSMTFN